MRRRVTRLGVQRRFALRGDLQRVLFAARAQPSHQGHVDRSPEVMFKRLHAPSLTPFQEATRSHPHPLCKTQYLPRPLPHPLLPCRDEGGRLYLPSCHVCAREEIH